MKVLPLSEVKTRLSELVDVVERRDEPITITRNGKPIAIIVSKDEYDGWQETVEILQDPQFLALHGIEWVIVGIFGTQSSMFERQVRWLNAVAQGHPRPACAPLLRVGGHRWVTRVRSMHWLESIQT